MASPLIPDSVWELVKPHFPQRPPRSKGGRPMVDDRDILTGILFVLKTGISWDDLPFEMGCGCGVTCLRRLREWHQSGTWQQVSRILERSLWQAKRINWLRAEVDARNGPRQQRRRFPVIAGYDRGPVFISRMEPAEEYPSGSSEQSPITES